MPACAALLLSVVTLLAAGQDPKPPRIVSVSPDPYLPGRTLFTLKGSGFVRGAKVAIASRAYGPREVLLGEPQAEVVSGEEIRLKLEEPAVPHGLGGGGATLQVRNPDGSASQKVAVAARPVMLHMMFQTHLDIGYNGPPSEIAERYKKFYDWVVKLISDDSEKDPDGQIRFTVETIWQLEQFIARSTPEEVRRFFDLVREGRIEVCAGYANPNTSAIAYEDLSRLFYPAAELRRTYGVPIETVVFNDQPGYAWGLAEAAAGSGLRYFACAVNLWKGLSIPGNPFPPSVRPFAWVGRSGARILTWTAVGEQDRGGRPWDETSYKRLHGGAYGSAAVDFGLLLVPAELVPPRWREACDEEHLEARVLQGLRFYADRDYPHARLLVMGANGDNNWVFGAANERSFRLFSFMAAAARRLNARGCGVRVRIDTPTAFFRALEKETTGRFPELPAPGARHGGDWPSCWEAADGAAPRSMARMRAVGELAPAVEKIAALNDLLGREDPYPADKLGGLWTALRVWNEHTSPGATINGEREGELTWTQVLQHDSEHVKCATDAEAGATKLAASELQTLGRRFADPRFARVVVANLTGWTRSDIVRVERPAEGPFDLVDEETGASVPWQASPEGVLFVAREVPANGYRVYGVRPRVSDPAFKTTLAVDAAGRRIENEFYKITLGEDGYVREIWDKALGRAIANPRGPYRFLRVSGIDMGEAFANGLGLSRVPHREAKDAGGEVAAEERGPIAASLVTSRRGSAQARTEVRLYDGLGLMEFRVTLDREALDPLGKGTTGWFMPFPLALAPGKMQIRLDCSSGYLDPFSDQIPGTFNDWLYVVHGLWAGDDRGSVELGCAESFVWDLPLAAGSVGLVTGVVDGMQRPGVAALLNWLGQTERPRLVTFKSGPAQPGDQDPKTPGYQAYPVREPGAEGPVTLSYRMRSSPGATFDAASTASFFGTINNPLMAVVVRAAGPVKLRLPAAASLVRSDLPGVEITGFKKSAAGRGYVVRLREVSGRGGRVTLSSDVFEIRSARRVNLVEEAQPGLAEVEVRAGRASLPVRGFETAAILVEELKVAE